MLRDHGHRFDEWAARYDRGPARFFFHWVHRRVVASLGRHPLPPGVIVDVGAGTGELLVRVARSLGRTDVAAVDTSTAMIKMAAPKLPVGTAIVGSAAALPLTDGCAAAVLTTLSFHHWAPQDVALAEVARVLRPGGHVLLVDFLADGPIGSAVGRRAGHHGAGARTLQELVTLFEGAGLRYVDAARLGPPASPLRLVTGYAAQ